MDDRVPLVAIPVTARVFRRVELAWSEFLRVLSPSIAGCLMMAAAILGVKDILPPRYGLPLRLALFILAGAVAYVVVAGGLRYSRRHALMRAINLLRNRGSGPAV